MCLRHPLKTMPKGQWNESDICGNVNRYSTTVLYKECFDYGITMIFRQPITKGEFFYMYVQLQSELLNKSFVKHSLT